MQRREFLKSGFLGSAAFAVSGLTTLTPRIAEAATVNVNLSAEGVFKNLIDNTSVYVWQFNDVNGTGPGRLTSGLVVTEGDDVNITITNNLDRAINLVIPGVLSSSPSVSPGSSRTYSFTAPAAGSYYYTDGVNGEIGKAMGLSGPLVVMPSSGSNTLYTGGPAFNRQYTLVLNELDDRLNNAIFNGLSYDMANYEPNYFFVNGMSYPDTTTDVDTRVAMNLGENVAIRFINTGCITNPQHFHGYHVNIASRNRVPDSIMGEKDTVLVNVDECVDVIIPVIQTGDYPLHTHYVPGVTANGSYANGALIILSAV
ncbi:MAG: multicopper oxidase domain-containing protein [Gammaproteobacteria bacterium]|nr:multicopper oxidase domain-containing protein [Gammaproteobacteria bacterium]